jgi:predicted HTH transcriptional regulator
MTFDPKTVADLEALREGWDFEAKRAAGRDGLGKVPDSMWETVSAFANTRGGIIALGVAQEADGRLRVEGLGDPERVERELWDLLQNRQKISANLLTRSDVESCVVEGRTVLLVHVPRAPRADRPVHLGTDPFTGTWLRVHEGDRRADRERVRRMIADATYGTRDDRVLPSFGIADLEPESLRAYRQVFRTSRPDHPWAALGDQEFLTQIGGFRRDRESGESGPTLAGLLMFGRFAAIREHFPDYFLDYQQREAQATAIEWTDRVFPDGTWSGNVYDFFRRVMPRMIADLSVPFRLGADMIRRDETHVHEAVREAFVNCLIHADYEGRVPVLVVKRPAEFEFRNPGLLRVSIEQVRQGGISDCRNRTLQTMFLHLGIGETAGSGFSRILRAWREQHWRTPTLEEDIENDATTLRLSMASLIPPDVLAALDERFDGDFSHLDENQRLAVAIAEMEGKVTNRRMQASCTVHPRDLTFLFRELVDRGFLAPHGERGGTWYTVEDGEPDRKDPRSTQSSTQTPASSTQSPAQTGSSSTQTGRNRWRPSDETRAAILAYCADRFRTSAEIAEHLGRVVRTVRARYLPVLVAEGALTPLYPGAPSHPQQAYRTRSAP